MDDYNITVKPDGSWSQLGHDYGAVRTVKVIRSFTTAKPDGSVKDFFAILRWGGGKSSGRSGVTYPTYYRLVRIVETMPVHDVKDGVTYRVETVFEMQPGRYSHKALTELDRYARELV